MAIAQLETHYGDLTFLIEQPTIHVAGIDLSTVDVFRVTVDADGEIVTIEMQEPSGKPWVLPPEHMIWPELARIAEQSGDVERVLAEYWDDRPNQIADRRNAWREPV